MRKFILAAALAVLGVAVFATSASAFDHHFTVLAKQKSAQRAHNSVRFKDKLLDPNNRHNKVGRDRGKCRFSPRKEKVKCHAVIHLNGEIGGVGNIRVRGDVERDDHHLVVLGGTRQFDGVAGKMTIHNTKNRRIDRLHFDLVR
jgi:hypothetical protein